MPLFYEDKVLIVLGAAILLLLLAITIGGM